MRAIPSSGSLAASPLPSPWSPAAFYETGPGGAARCTLCPHGCTLEEGETGQCGVRRLRGGALETATRALAVKHLDAVEKKPLYHFYPGRPVLTLGPPGCSFRCNYCLNHRLAQLGGSALVLNGLVQAVPERLAADAAASGAILGLSYAEPSLALELTLDLALAAQPLSVPLIWKTNGFLTPAALAAVVPVLSAVNLDVKASEERRHRALTGASLAPVLATLDALLEAGVWVEISTPVIPGFNDTDADLSALASALRARSTDLPWHLVRFVPELRMARFPPTPPETLGRAREIGRAAGLRHVYVERALGPEGRATLCSRCSHVLVERGIWSLERLALEDGHCPGCRSPVSGRW